MVGASMRDIQTARAAGCAHLLRGDRLGALSLVQIMDMVAQVPGTIVHEDLGAFC